jgi:U32 family peptidase
MKKPILLSPVGSFDMLISAIDAGCNAVYLGIKGINMRERARNFTLNDLPKVVKYAHERKVEVYLTLNTIIFDNEIKKIKKILDKAKKSKVDAIIAWDLSVIKLAREKKIPVHLSTQASVSNIEAIKEYYKLGIKRFVLARELSLDQIKKIIIQAKKISKDIEIETFIHGAMCVSLSGRCFLSQFLYGDKTSANRGKCIQPCRREYIVKDKETNKELEIKNNFILSPKDLNTILFIDRLIKAKIDVFKIEGRAKGAEYVKIVTESYKEAIDLFFKKKLTTDIKKKLYKKLDTVYNRGFSDGFYQGKPIDQWTDAYGNKSKTKKTYLGKITNVFKKINVIEIKLEVKDLKLNDNILIIGDKVGTLQEKVKSIQRDVNTPLKIAKKGEVVAIKLSSSKLPKKNDKVYLFQ